ncbi:MAG: hypothetical protein SCALA702_38030 [Melioribacteraceae bacterium]|nr:MAG: hypothetical protein SCALA702_38030 [Melioribacteraceae bacterium]
MNYSPKVLQDQFLQANKSELSNLKSELESIFEKYTENQKKWKPSSKEWSIIEVTAHMAQTLRMYLDKMEPVKVKTKDRGLVQVTAFSPTWFGRLFVKFISPESSFKLKTFKIFKPEKMNVSGSPETLLFDYISRLINFINDIDGYDIKKLRFSSPASSFVRFTLGEAIEINVVHIQRHIAQIKRLTQSENFPGH